VCTVVGVIDDTGRNLAQWLREIARGRPVVPAVPAESGEGVLQYLEQKTGRKLRSRLAVDAYLQDLEAQESAAHRRGMRRGIVRGAILLALVAAAYLQYYYWDVKLEIASLPGVEVFVPVEPGR
jgi:hypothetical protein